MKNYFQLAASTRAVRILAFVFFLLIQALAWGQGGGYIVEKNYAGIDLGNNELNDAFEALYNKIPPSDRVNFKIYDLAFYRIGEQVLSASGQSMDNFVDSLTNESTYFFATCIVWDTDQHISELSIKGELPTTFPVVAAYGNNHIFKTGSRSLAKKFEKNQKNINSVRLLQKETVLKLVEILGQEVKLELYDPSSIHIDTTSLNSAKDTIKSSSRFNGGRTCITPDAKLIFLPQEIQFYSFRVCADTKHGFLPGVLTGLYYNNHHYVAFTQRDLVWNTNNAENEERVVFLGYFQYYNNNENFIPDLTKKYQMESGWTTNPEAIELGQAISPTFYQRFKYKAIGTLLIYGDNIVAYIEKSELPVVLVEPIGAPVALVVPCDEQGYYPINVNLINGESLAPIVNPYPIEYTIPLAQLMNQDYMEPRILDLSGYLDGEQGYINDVLELCSA